MKKLTVSSIRKQLNLLLSYEISMSRFVEMINDEIGFERDIQIENKEINENIIYVDNTTLNLFLLDKFGYSNNFKYCYYYEISDIIIINLNTKEYTTFNPTDDIIKNIITSDSLFNIINK